MAAVAAAAPPVVPSAADSAIVIIQPIKGGYKIICSEAVCARSFNPVAVKIYDTITKVREFFLQNFDHHGLDGHGKMVPMVIGWDKKNAQWTCQTGKCLLRFHDVYAVAPEVVAHEFMHGVIANLNPLRYYKQAGALNESLADAMGIAFKQWWKGTSDWKIANLRDMSHHASMGDYVETEKDSGGVHTNSAIPNHAFYCAATNAKSVIGVAKIWFTAFQQVSRTASFKNFAKKTIEVAKTSSSIAVKVLAAWKHVGVLDVTVQSRIKTYWDENSMTLMASKEPVYFYA